MNGLYTVLDRGRKYGLGCEMCRGIIVGPASPHDGLDPRLDWIRHNWPENQGWDYMPLCPHCGADLDFIAVEEHG